MVECLCRAVPGIPVAALESNSDSRGAMDAELNQVAAQIEQALKNLDVTELNHENEPSDDTRADIAFKRNSVVDLRKKEEQMISLRLKEKDIEILRLKLQVASLDSGSDTARLKINFCYEMT